MTANVTNGNGATFRIAPDYFGLCAKCGQDVFGADEAISEWVPFDDPIAWSPETLAMFERADLVPPDFEGVWQIVHKRTCQTEGKRYREIER